MEDYLHKLPSQQTCSVHLVQDTPKMGMCSSSGVALKPSKEEIP